MNDPVSSFLLDFNRVVEECSVFTFITRDGELQKQTCQKLGACLSNGGVCAKRA